MTAPNKISQKHRECAHSILLHAGKLCINQFSLEEILSEHFPTVTRDEAIEKISNRLCAEGFKYSDESDFERYKRILERELAQVLDESGWTRNPIEQGQYWPEYVQCRKCRILYRTGGHGVDSAIEAWNTRSDTSEIKPVAWKIKNNQVTIFSVHFTEDFNEADAMISDEDFTVTPLYTRANDASGEGDDIWRIGQLIPCEHDTPCNEIIRQQDEELQQLRRIIQDVAAALDLGSIPNPVPNELNLAIAVDQLRRENEELKKQAGYDKTTLDLYTRGLDALKAPFNEPPRETSQYGRLMNLGYAHKEEIKSLKRDCAEKDQALNQLFSTASIWGCRPQAEEWMKICQSALKDNAGADYRLVTDEKIDHILHDICKVTGVTCALDTLAEIINRELGR